MRTVRDIQKFHQPQSYLESDNSESEHSYEFVKPVKAADVEYISTNLITEQNLKISDISVLRLSYNDIEYEVRNCRRRPIAWSRSTVTIDPKAELKEAKAFGEVTSLVSAEDIQFLAKEALILHLAYVQDTKHEQPQEGEGER